MNVVDEEEFQVWQDDASLPSHTGLQDSFVTVNGERTALADVSDQWQDFYMKQILQDEASLSPIKKSLKSSCCSSPTRSSHHSVGPCNIRVSTSMPSSPGGNIRASTSMPSSPGARLSPGAKGLPPLSPQTLLTRQGSLQRVQAGLPPRPPVLLPRPLFSESSTAYQMSSADHRETEVQCEKSPFSPGSVQQDPLLSSIHQGSSSPHINGPPGTTSLLDILSSQAADLNLCGNDGLRKAKRGLFGSEDGGAAAVANSNSRPRAMPR